MSDVIGKAWRSYKHNVIPSSASKIQLEESERAFYAGAATMFEALTVVGADTVSEDAGVLWIQAISDELDKHIEDIKRRRGI